MTTEYGLGRLNGKVAIVTGGGSGIGLAIAERFYSEGASVVVADYSGNQTAVVQRLGPQALAVQADVRVSSDIKNMFTAAVEHFGGIDVVCNNAGIDGEIHYLTEVEEDAFDLIIATNLRSVFLGMKYAIPFMKSRGGGSIINIASTAGLIAAPGLGVYGATKAGVIQLSRSAAVEYAKDNIRVNAICPGMTETPLVAHLMLTNPNDAARTLSMTPLGRAAQPREIADAALYLACNESSYVSGTSLVVDGAYTAQ